MPRAASVIDMSISRRILELAMMVILSALAVWVTVDFVRFAHGPHKDVADQRRDLWQTHHVRGAERRSDLYGDPLPSGAIARLGTVRWRHPRRITAISMTSDASVWATTSEDGFVRLWDREGRSMGQLEGRQSPGYCVAVSPDGKHVASGEWNGAIRISSIESGKLEYTLSGHEKTFFSTLRQHVSQHLNLDDGPSASWVAAVAYLPDGRRLVSAGGDGSIRTWDVRRGVQTQLIEAHRTPICALAISPDGRSAISAGDDRTIRIWDLASGNPIDEFAGQKHAVETLALSADGQLLAVSDQGLDPLVSIWDVAERSLLGQLTSPAGPVIELAFSPDGHKLAAGTQDESVAVWKVVWNNGRQSEDPPTEHLNVSSTDSVRAETAGSSDSPPGLNWPLLWNRPRSTRLSQAPGGPQPCLMFTPDSRHVVTRDHAVRFFDAENGNPLDETTGHVSGISGLKFLEQADSVVTVADDAVIHWDTESGRAKQVIGLPVNCRAVAVGPEGQVIIARILDNETTEGPSTRPALLRVERLGEQGALLETSLEGLEVRRVTVSVDGQYTAVSGNRLQTNRDGETPEDIVTKVYQAGNVQPMFEIEAAGFASVFSPDGSRLSVPMRDGKDWAVGVWKLPEPRPTFIVKASGVRPWSAIFSPDGKHLAVAGNDWTVQILSAEKGTVVRALNHGDMQFFRFAFSNDSRWLAAVGRDGQVSVWNLLTDKMVHSLSTGQRHVSQVAFSADGARLCTAASDTTALIWNVTEPEN